MFGAIIGDIVGSRFEFNNCKDEKFKLFTKDTFFTDDTVMTCAVAHALINSNKDITQTLQEYGRAFPYAGYGGRFLDWIFSKNPRPYNSYGNGAAMRVSPVSWFAKSEKEVKYLAKKVTEVTHNHPDALKGAEVVAICIYRMLHNKSNKEDIYNYVKGEYPEIETFTYEDLVNNYKFTEKCSETVPQAIYCFLISKSFEDCIRKTVMIGGDTDTLCAISGALAEAFYGIPFEIVEKVFTYLNNNEKTKKYLLEPIMKLYNGVYE